MVIFHWQHFSIARLGEFQPDGLLVAAINSVKAITSMLTARIRYQHERGESHNIQAMLQLALAIVTKRQNIDLADLESDIRYSLGAVANETNDGPSCLQYNKIFLEIQLEVTKTTGKFDERLPRAHNQLGTGWMMAAEYVKAEEAFATAASLYEQLPEYNKGLRSIPLANLGLAYWLQGRLESASQVLEAGLNDRVELYGFMDKHSFR